MKLDQIAIAVRDEKQSAEVKRHFGLIDRPWIEDIVTAESIVWPLQSKMINKAHLQFNYDLGIELEILRYIEGPNWHTSSPLFGELQFISHVGIHLNDDERMPEVQDWPLVQETFTLSHTAEYLTKEGSPGFGRKYHYRIFEMAPGSYVKYIKRINKQ